MIITIGRECGCMGDEIGKKLSEKFGIPCYTKKELIREAKEKKIYDKYPMYFGEVNIETMMNPMDEDFKERLRSTPKEVLFNLIGNNDCVIIGRASNYAFKNREDAVRVFLSGELDKRVSYISQKHDISKRKAEILVQETDDRRKNYHMYYTGEEWGYAGNYDICLDQTKLHLEGAVEMIYEYVKRCP